MAFRVWSISLGVVVAASFISMEKPLGGDNVADNFGSCLISEALTESDSGFSTDQIMRNCHDSFDQTQNVYLNPWASVDQCYDEYQMRAPSQQAALLVFQGCAWYFRAQA